MKQWLRSFTLCAVIAALAVPVAAQQAQEKAAGPVKTMADGVLAGHMVADRIGAGGSFAGGLVGGLLVGLIGTGIAWAVQGPAELPVADQVEAQKYGSEYTLGLQQGFTEKSRKKKKSAALTGGLVGTGALVLLVVSTSGQ